MTRHEKAALRERLNQEAKQNNYRADYKADSSLLRTSDHVFFMPVKLITLCLLVLSLVGSKGDKP